MRTKLNSRYIITAETLIKASSNAVFMEIKKISRGKPLKSAWWYISSYPKTLGVSLQSVRNPRIVPSCWLKNWNKASLEAFALKIKEIPTFKTSIDMSNFLVYSYYNYFIHHMHGVPTLCVLWFWSHSCPSIAASRAKIMASPVSPDVIKIHSSTIWVNTKIVAKKLLQ